MLAFVDDDILVEPGWLAALTAALGERPEERVAHGPRRRRRPEDAGGVRACAVGSHARQGRVPGAAPVRRARRWEHGDRASRLRADRRVRRASRGRSRLPLVGGQRPRPPAPRRRARDRPRAGGGRRPPRVAPRAGVSARSAGATGSGRAGSTRSTPGTAARTGCAGRCATSASASSARRSPCCDARATRRVSSRTARVSSWGWRGGSSGAGRDERRRLARRDGSHGRHGRPHRPRASAGHAFPERSPLTFDDGPSAAGRRRSSTCSPSTAPAPPSSSSAVDRGRRGRRSDGPSREGHELGNHAYSHADPATLDDETLRARARAHDGASSHGSWAGGRLSSARRTQRDRRVARVARDAGLSPTVLRSVDPADWREPDSRSHRGRRARGRSDPARSCACTTACRRQTAAGTADRGPTVAALPPILAGLRTRGLAAVTVSELLGGARESE